jgi:two-component system invasion response regulator UvrY
MPRLVLVDDHEIVRTGLRMILEKIPGVEIVAECEDGDEALQAVREHRPDVVLMDVNMPRLSGLEATRRIVSRYPDTRVIILTIHAQSPFPAQLLEAGASGYLTKGCASDELTKAIQVVSRGGKYIGTDIAQQMALSMLPGGNSSPFDDLSTREMEVMLMMVQGKGVKEIGELLSISPKTVATYKYRILDKLNVDNVVELTHLAMNHGVMDQGETLT